MKRRINKGTNDNKISKIKPSWSKDILDTQAEIRKMIETVQNTSLSFSLSDSSCDDIEKGAKDENDKRNDERKISTVKSQRSNNENKGSIPLQSNQTTQTEDRKHISPNSTKTNSSISSLMIGTPQDDSIIVESNKHEKLKNLGTQTTSTFRHLKAKTEELLHEKIESLREKGGDSLRELHQLRSRISHTMKVLQNYFDEVRHHFIIFYFQWVVVHLYNIF